MDIERAERAPQPVVGVHGVVAMSDLSDFFDRALAVAAAGLARAGIAPAGPPVALYTGDLTDTVDVLAGFPVERPVTAGDGLETATLPGGEIVQTVHTGSDDALSMTYGELAAWFAEHGLTPAEQVWEEYLVGQDTEADPARWQTRIVFPVA